MSAKKLAIVDIPVEGWTAGGVYTRTAAAALGEVATQLRPDVQIFRVTSDVTPLVGVTLQEMPQSRQSMPAETLLRRFIGVGEGVHNRALPGERRFRQLLRLPDERDPVWVAEKRGMDVAFPVLAVPRRSARMGMVGWVPDLQHLHFPHFFGSDELVARDRQFRLLAERCHRVVFSSDTVRQEFIEHFRGFEKKSRTLRFPSRYVFEHPEDVDVAAMYGLPRRYFLCANQFWRHKNHMLVLEGVLKAIQSDPQITCVFTGLPVDGRDPENTYLSEILQFIALNRLTDNVRVLGLVPKSHLDALLVGAEALVQPSLSEGWNTSVEDAKALGTRVIALDTDVLREQAPDGLLLGPASSEWASALLAVPDAELSVSRGRAFAQTTAEEFGPKLLEICMEASHEAKRDK